MILKCKCRRCASRRNDNAAQRRAYASVDIVTDAATAAGTASDGTCSLTEDCQAGPISAMPLPTAKQRPSKRFVVVRFSH